MVANIKYYVVTIVSIFLAIALGIFVGFMLNAQDILSSQRDEIIVQLEEKFDYLKEENEKVKKESNKTKAENEKLTEFNRTAYSIMIKGRLEGKNIAVIETSDDYLYTEVNQTLVSAGANSVSNTTIKDALLLDKEKLKEIYKTVKETEKEPTDLVQEVVREITSSLLTGDVTPLVSTLNEQGLIDITGTYEGNVDYVVLGGGSLEKNDERYKLVDKTIIDSLKKNETPIIGIEKEDVKNSYIDRYKESRISSVDNVDSTIGKITLVLAMDGNPGNYGVKPSAGSLAPVDDTQALEKAQ